MMKEAIQQNIPKLRFPEFDGEWESIKLGDESNKIGSGVTPKGGSTSYLESGIPLLRSQNIRDSFLDVTDVAFISSETHEKMANSKISEGDILLNITGASIGRSCVVPIGIEEANVNQHVCIIRLKKGTNSKFIQTILASEMGQKLIFQSQAGGGREGLNFENIRNFKIQMPKLQEQEKVASFLTSVDTKINQLVKKKTLWEAYKKGCTQQLFSQAIRFKADDGSEFPEWVEKKLNDFCEIISGQPVAGTEISESSAPIRLLRGVNITEGRIRRSIDIDRYHSGRPKNMKNFIVEVGDIVLGMDGSKVGRNVAVIDEKEAGSFLIQRVARMRQGPQNALSYAYHHVFSNSFHRYVDQVNTSSGIPHISLKQIRDFVIISPASLEEQTKIADFLTSIDRKIDLITQELEQAKTFKKGLLQQMFA